MDVNRKSLSRKTVPICAAVLLSGIAVEAATPDPARICDPPAAALPDDFPTQPINIFIPRGRSSGAIRLSAQIAEQIRALTDGAGTPLGIEVNLLTKFGGDATNALDYFQSLPPSGYNVVQLNDTYASLVAQSREPQAALVPVGISQIAFSQVYIRSDDARFSDLASFVSHAAEQGDDPVRVARFGTGGATLGLEDILLDRFADEFMQIPAPPEDGADAGLRPFPLPLEQAGFESGSERYVSLFDKAQSGTRQTDALLEQPGDVARLLDRNLIKPIFTLLPQDRLSPEFESRMGPMAAFSGAGAEGCPMLYRFRGFFVSQDVPEDRRRFLEWAFLSAFNSDAFQQVIRDGYMDLLYPDDAIRRAYCSADAAGAFFDERVRIYAACFRTHDIDRTEHLQDVNSD